MGSGLLSILGPAPGSTGQVEVPGDTVRDSPGAQGDGELRSVPTPAGESEADLEREGDYTAKVRLKESFIINRYKFKGYL